MKYSLFFGVLFAMVFSFGPSSFAAPHNPQDDLRFVCATGPLTATYALFDTDDGGYKLHLVNHEGAQFVPIHEGLITAYDLKFLAKKADLFQKLGDRFVFSFQKGECSLKKEEWSCFREGSFRIGELDVENVSFHLKKKKVETTLIVYESYRALFSFRVGNEGFTIPMEYGKADCQFKR
ncbi:MAG TPA: hypothetical protein PL182_09625 [Pseudobdellovibrionaceae bacterium]|nr:hypothetical protein [Pseudobdellovibrionaceae bacterium]